MYLWSFRSPVALFCSIVWNLSELIGKNLMGKYTPYFFGKICGCKGSAIKTKEGKNERERN